MITWSIDRFLTSGSGNLPAPNDASRPWVAVGIHPSSEVDCCLIGSTLLTVRTIVPLNGETSVRALRLPKHGSTLLSGLTYLQNPLDQITAPGDKLVLILWEACDDIEAPGPRVPLLRQAFLRPTPQTEALAALVFRIPFSGRAFCALYATGLNQDLVIGVTGIKYPLIDQPTSTAHFIEMPTQTASSTTTVAFGPGNGGLQQSKGIYLTEAFDELAVFAWAPGGTNGSWQVNAEVSGELTV